MFMVKGVVTALITPFTSDGDLCEECLEELMRFQFEKGVNGLFISGTYGEGVITPYSTREKLLKKAIEYAPSSSVVLPHIGSSDPEIVLNLAKLAKDLGYQAVSIVGPIFHPPTKQGLIKFYSYIAAKADVPIVIYNNKNRQGYNISPDDFELLTKEVPQIIGVKDTSYEPDQVLEYVIRFGNKYFIACGGDNFVLYAFTIGSHAHICGISNAFPELAVSIHKAVLNRDFAKAIKLQYKVSQLRKMSKKYGVESSEIQRAILRLRGINAGYPPLQLTHSFTQQQLEELKNIVEQFCRK